MTFRPVAAVAALLLAVAAAFAQETPPGRPGDAAPAAEAAPPPAETFLRTRALDYTPYLEAQNAGRTETQPAGLADQAVTVLYTAPGGVSGSLEVRTDADGRLNVPLANVPKEASLSFLVTDPSRGDRWPLYMAPPRRTDQHGDLPFVRVRRGADPMAIAELHYVVTVPDLAEGAPSLRVRMIATLVNQSDEVWLGSPDVPVASRSSFRMPIPGETQVVQVRMGNLDRTITVAPAGEGQEIVLREPLWPGETTAVFLVTAPWRDGGEYDFSFTSKLPIGSMSLNLEEGVLEYKEDGKGVELQDAGVNAGMGSSQKQTHAWSAEHVHAGQRVGVRFGPAPYIHRRVVYTLVVLGLVLAGAALLGKALAKRAAGAPVVGARPPEARPRSPDEEDVAEMIASLERRHRQGKITSFEYAARRKQLESGGRTEPVTAETAPPRKPSSADDAQRLADEIAGRVDTADAATLRRDVKALLVLLRARR